jgi:acyl-CoA thioester hydrolase
MDNINDQFASSVNIRIRYDDLDTLGHVNNKVYLSYLEEGRIEYIKQVSGLNKNLNFDVVVGRIDIKYQKPLFFGDKVKVYSRVSRIGIKSYDTESYIVKINKHGHEVASVATVSMISYDVKTGKTKNNPEEMIKKILKFEKIQPLINSTNNHN